VASNGEKVSIKMGDYEIATMDMKLDLNLTSTNCYISIEDMAVYNATSAAAIPDKIDLVFCIEILQQILLSLIMPL